MLLVGNRDGGSGVAANRAGQPLSAAVVSIALFAANASSYLFTVVAARLLVPGAFGELSALMAVLVVGAVPAMGLQTGVTLVVAADDRQRDAAARSFGLGLASAVGLAALGLAATPALIPLVRSSAGASLALAIALAPVTVLGALRGILQGDRRFGAMAVLVGLEAVGRTGGALAGLAVRGTPAAAMTGLAIGSVVVAVTGWVVCGRPRPARPSRASARLVGYAVPGMLGLFLLLNLDVVLARHVLPADQSGLYAVGAIVTKIAYWLPQAVGVITLPHLVNAAGRRRVVAVALIVTACLDIPVVLVAAGFGNTVLRTIGGPGYHCDCGPLAPVWLFALTGSLLALTQLLLFARIASADHRTIDAVWAAVGLEIGLVAWRLHDSVGQVATAAATSAGLLVAAGLIIEWRAARYPQGGGDHRADGDQHRALDPDVVRPVLPVPRQPAGDRDGGRDDGAAERDSGQATRPHLPY
jgi:O-antigen/teichoic acid export membrane protein